MPHQKSLFSTNTFSHDAFIILERMTFDEFGDNQLKINYSFQVSAFGNLLIATTHKGICYMAFDDDFEKAATDLKTKFKQAELEFRFDERHKQALCIFINQSDQFTPLKLHVHGTDFQINVWQELLKIPFGKLLTYGTIAQQLKTPKASRAVGTAIGSNPVAFLIPCHRVIQSTGGLGGYMWGKNRKKALINWELTQSNYFL